MARPQRRRSEQPGDGFKNRYMSFGPRRINVMLDDETWTALQEIARREQLTVAQVCLMVSIKKKDAVQLSRALRAHILRYFREAATEEGHRKAGHGPAV